jgi:hypothetical protein
MWETTQFSVALKAAAAPSSTSRRRARRPTLKQRIGLTDIEVVYSRPSAKGRVMLGGNQSLWRRLEDRRQQRDPHHLQHPGHRSRARPSAPVPTSSSRSRARTSGRSSSRRLMHQWGAYAYDPKNDVLRVTAKPEPWPSPSRPSRSNSTTSMDESATLDLIWENTRVPVPKVVDVVGVLVPKIEAAMAGPGKKPY